MNVALLFFLLLVPLSGFIAWAGDRIGHKSGKKRHSLFGMRPRHTATVITVAAGMCISLVTFGLMWAGNATFRDILARGAELIQTNADLKRENDSVQKQVAAKQSQIGQLDREVTDYQRRAEIAARDRAMAEKDYLAAKRNSERAKADLGAAKERLSALQQRLNAAGSALASAKGQVASARSDLGLAQAQLGQAQVQLGQARARKDRAEAAAKGAHARMVQADAQLAEAKDQLGSARRVFNQVTDVQARNLQHQKDELATQQEQIAGQQKQLALVEDELTNRRKELESLQGAVVEFRRNAAALRAHQITYRVGEELDRVSIPAGTNVWRTEFIVDSLLNSSGKKAEARGAQRIARTQRAVALAPMLAPPPPAGDHGAGAAPPPGTTVLAQAGPSGPGPDAAGGSSPLAAPGAQFVPLITESDLVRTAAEAIRRDNRDVVVIAVAAANAVAGEPVPVDIRTFHNPVVLNSGAEVGEVTVDGTASRQEIVDALYGFLHHDVRSRLLQAGIIPPLGGSEDGEGSIVTLSGDAWLKILDDVRKAGSRARVVVKADRTTRAADPVSLRFEVKRNWDSKDLPGPPGGSDAAAGGVTRSGDGMALH